jgi:hypothetical protein
MLRFIQWGKSVPVSVDASTANPPLSHDQAVALAVQERVNDSDSL